MGENEGAEWGVVKIFFLGEVVSDLKSGIPRNWKGSMLESNLDLDLRDSRGEKRKRNKSSKDNFIFEFFEIK